MAIDQLSMTFEAELIWDAVETVMRAHELLARRHGEAFRRLEQRIEALGNDGAELGEVAMSQLEPGRFVMSPPAKLLELIAEARALGVLRRGER